MPATATGLYVPTGGAPGDGYQASIALPPQLPHSDLRYTVGPSFYEEILNFQALYVTDGNVGIRSVTLTIQDANGAFLSIMPSAGTQAQSLSYYYNFTPSLAVPTKDSVGGVIGGPPPPMILLPNWSAVMVVSGAGAGDLFSQAVMTVNRIPTGVAQPAALELVPTPIAL